MFASPIVSSMNLGYSLKSPGPSSPELLWKDLCWTPSLPPPNHARPEPSHIERSPTSVSSVYLDSGDNYYLHFTRSFNGLKAGGLIRALIGRFSYPYKS